MTIKQYFLAYRHEPFPTILGPFKNKDNLRTVLRETRPRAGATE